MSVDPSMGRGDRPAIEPAARLVPISGAKRPRRLGTLAGKLHVPDDFDDPLPDEIIAQFEGR